MNLSGGYSTTPTFAWNTSGLKLGTYSLDVLVRGSNSTAPYDNFGLLPFVLHGCESASVSPDATQQPASAAVSFTVTPNGCTNAVRQLWYLGPSGVWQNTGPFAAGPTVSFPASTLPPGNYSVDVWVKDAASPNQYDTYGLATYQVGNACAPATVTSSGGSSQPLGGSSTFTATAGGGCTSPSYQWWLLPPNGSWQMRQPYGAGTWNQTFSAASFEPGTYSVDAWVKQPGSTASYDTYGLSSFTLTTCTSATLAAAPSSPQPAGTAITLTAGSSGCAAEYQFWVLPPGGSWTSLGPFTSTNTATWSTAQAGNYALVVWVRPQGSSTQYATYGMTNFTLQ